MTNKFYGIGVGVGEPEQLTLKAVNILKKLDIVILPEAKKNEGSVAFEITKKYLKENIEKVFLEFPMLKSIEDREKARKKNTDIVMGYLDKGKNVGFLTIGDPMTYSTYVYILENLTEKYNIETIPGISSFVDMASRFNFPLMMGEETLKIISLNKNIDIISEINSSDNLVFMKISKNFENLKSAILETGNENNIIIVSNSGKETQKVYYDIKKLEKEDIPYFTTLILKKGGFEKWKKFIL